MRAIDRSIDRSIATELKKVFSWLAIGPAISNFIGPFSAGLLIDHAGVWMGGQAADTNGFRGAFLLMALLPLMTWAWIRRTAELAPVVAPPDLASDASIDAPPKKTSSALDLLRMPMMRRLMLVNLLLAACWDVHTFVVPVMGHQLGFSASVIGAILGGFAVSATLIRVVLPLVPRAFMNGWCCPQPWSGRPCCLPFTHC